MSDHDVMTIRIFPVLEPERDERTPESCKLLLDGK
jgi:hypothetical protein